MSSNQTQAANSEHKFRYLLPPGSNFQFVSRFRLFFAISVLLIGASIGMLFVNKAVRGEMLNWTIDFKGGTELIFAFKDKNDPQKFVPVAPGVVRNALRDSGEANFDVGARSCAPHQTNAMSPAPATPRTGSAAIRAWRTA